MPEDFTEYTWRKDGQIIKAFVDEGIDEDSDEFQAYYKILECHCRPGDESKMVMSLVVKLPKIKRLLKLLKRGMEAQSAAVKAIETSCDIRKHCHNCEAVQGCQLYRELRETGKDIDCINRQLVRITF
jgi:hypothetical protein